MARLANGYGSIVPLRRAAVISIARCIVAAVFVIAAVPKLLDPRAFALAISNYRLLPDAQVGATAVLLPGVELAVGLAVLLRYTRRPAQMLGVALGGLFLFANMTAVARGLNVSCGCFGSNVPFRTGWLHVVMNAGFLILVAWSGGTEHPSGCRPVPYTRRAEAEGDGPQAAVP